MGGALPRGPKPTRISPCSGTLDLSGVDGPYRSRLPRGQFDVEAAVAIVRPIVDDVAARGAEALNEYSHRFDGVVPPSLRVPPEARSRPRPRGSTPNSRRRSARAIRRRREVASTLEIDADPVAATLADGARVGLRNVPVERVGLYVPGGLAPLASSVIMNVVPAQVAGVPSIAVASPPQKEFGGLPHPNIPALFVTCSASSRGLRRRRRAGRRDARARRRGVPASRCR